MRAMFVLLILLALAGGAVWVVLEYDRLFPLDLREPPGLLAGTRLKLLGTDADACYAVLDRSEVTYRTASRPIVDGCGYEDGAVLTASEVDWGGNVLLRCPAMASLVAWKRHVVQPAAEEEMGVQVTAIRQVGTYYCRNVYHRTQGRRSQHATANAIDITSFVFDNGQTAVLARDWEADNARGRFLRRVRDGACPLFGAVLGPDYNAAHHDHFHLDMGRWNACR